MPLRNCIAKSVSGYQRYVLFDIEETLDLG